MKQKTILSLLRKGFFPALVASALALSPNLASAQVSAVGVGLGVPGDVSLEITDAPNLYSTLDVFVETAGVTLSSPGMSSFSDASWVDQDVSQTWSTASGNPNGSLTWDVNFTDPVPSIFTADLWSFDSSGNYVDSGSMTYDNGNWSFNSPVQSYAADVAADAPEPASIFLIGSGVLAVGFIRRRARARQ